MPQPRVLPVTQRFNGRPVLVTGAASGIGAATARRFAAEGATVYCADIDTAGADRTATALGGAGIPLELDITDEDQWARAVSRVLAGSGRLDILVNCAGISFAAPVDDMSLPDWRRVFAVNLDGAFLGMKHGIRAMGETGGCIINVSSASGIRPAAGACAYSASKAALGMLTRAVAKECRDRKLGIRVNAVAPGGVKTPMWQSMPFFQTLVEQHGSAGAAFQVMAGESGGRFSEPEEIAEAILYLASEAAATVTGVELVIDDGYIL
jgi:3(or 17)beta-hydroxysteroid dehydrogenase